MFWQGAEASTIVNLFRVLLFAAPLSFPSILISLVVSSAATVSHVSSDAHGSVHWTEILKGFSSAWTLHLRTITIGSMLN